MIMKTKKPKVKYTFKKRRDVRFYRLSSLRKKIHIHQLRRRLFKEKGLTIEDYLSHKSLNREGIGRKMQSANKSHDSFLLSKSKSLLWL
jgi:hypothetical protein